MTVRARPDEDAPKVKRLVAAITAAAAARAEARTAEHEATEKVVAAVHAGKESGTSINRLATLAGVQRPQVRRWLEQPPPAPKKGRKAAVWSEDTLTAAAAARAAARAAMEAATKEVIKKVRAGDELGLKQTQMAELCGTDPRTIRTWLGLRTHN